MSRITVEDCLVKVEGYFELAHLASKRALQLSSGARSLISAPEDLEENISKKKEKSTVTALREIAEGLVDKDFFSQDLQNQPELSLDVADWIRDAQEKNELKNRKNN